MKPGWQNAISLDKHAGAIHELPGAGSSKSFYREALSVVCGSPIFRSAQDEGRQFPISDISDPLSLVAGHCLFPLRMEPGWQIAMSLDKHVGAIHELPGAKTGKPIYRELLYVVFGCISASDFPDEVIMRIADLQIGTGRRPAVSDI